MHDTRRHWGPFCVLLSNPFACDHFEFQLLVFAKLHDCDRVHWLTRFIIDEFDWHDLKLLLSRIDIVGGYIILLCRLIVVDV